MISSLWIMQKAQASSGRQAFIPGLPTWEQGHWETHFISLYFHIFLAKWSLCVHDRICLNVAIVCCNGKPLLPPSRHFKTQSLRPIHTHKMSVWGKLEGEIILQITHTKATNRPPHWVPTPTLLLVPSSSMHSKDKLYTPIAFLFYTLEMVPEVVVQ